MIGYASNTSILPDFGREVRDARHKTFRHITKALKLAKTAQEFYPILDAKYMMTMMREMGIFSI